MAKDLMMLNEIDLDAAPLSKQRQRLGDTFFIFLENQSVGVMVNPHVLVPYSSCFKLRVE